MKIGLGGIALGVLSSIGALAADNSGNYAIWGTGARSCNQFLNTESNGTGQAAFKHFLMGYLTAQNTVQEQTYDAIGEMSLNDVLVWLNNYCEAHRLDSFERAIARFLIEHYDARLQHAPGAPSSWGHSVTVPQ